MLSSFEFDGKEMVEGNDGDGNWIDGANVDDAGGSNCCNDERNILDHTDYDAVENKVVVGRTILFIF